MWYKDFQILVRKKKATNLWKCTLEVCEAPSFSF